MRKERLEDMKRQKQQRLELREFYGQFGWVQGVSTATGRKSVVSFGSLNRGVKLNSIPIELADVEMFTNQW